MKTCAVPTCQKELPTPLDEYGPIDSPVCQDCFLKGLDKGRPDDRIDQLEILISNLRCDITAQNSDVESIENQIEELIDRGEGVPCSLINERDREAKELYRVREKLRQAQDDLYFSNKRVEENARREQERLAAWKGTAP